MRDMFYLTRQILRYRLERLPDAGEEAALAQAFLKFGAIYVVADPNTSKPEWESKTFGIAIEDKALRLFMGREDAILYATKIGAILFGDTPMVMKASQAMVKSLIASYSQKGFIDKVWLCGKSPIRAKVGVAPFVKGVKQESASTIMDPDPIAAPSPDPESPMEPEKPVEVVPPENLLLVDEARKVLSEAKASERRKFDPSDKYLNFHQLMERLINTNKIDPASLDRQFDLPDGFTINLMNDVTACNVPKRIVAQYLQYFGLYEFLYLFKGQSMEIAQELKKAPDIDLYVIKQATSQAEERFKLISIKHGRKNGINIYQLKFKSELREKTMISSTKLNMVIGKDYVLEGLEPLPNNGGSSSIPNKNAASSSVAAIPSEEEVAAKLKELEQTDKKKRVGRPSLSMPPQQKDSRMTGKNRYISELPEEKMEKDTQAVIGFLKMTKGISEKDARRLIVPFDDDPEVMASFAAYTREKKSDNKFARRGYTPRRLMRELHYSPLEAFTMMAELQRKPDETLQKLKYRATDPQYQKKPADNTGGQ